MSILEKYNNSEYGHFRSKPCHNYVETSSDTELEALLEKETLVFVTGKPGNGKTQLVYNYIHKKYSAGANIKAIVEDSASSKNFLEACEENDVNLCDLLFLDDLNFILVLDLPFLKYDNFKVFGSIIIPENYRVIVTTRNQSCSDLFPTVCVDNRSFSELKEIYKSALTFSTNKEIDSFLITFKDNELHQLFSIIDNNTMIISLLSKSLYWDAKHSKNKASVITKEQLLNSKNWLWSCLGLPEIVDPYINTNSKSKKKRKTIIEYSLSLISDYSDDIYQKCVPLFCIWAGDSISKECLELACLETTPKEQSKLTALDIDNALDIGLLFFTDDDKEFVKMNPLLYKLFWLLYNQKTITPKNATSPTSENAKPSFKFELTLDFCINELTKIQKLYLENAFEDMTFGHYNAIILAAVNQIHYYLSSASKDSKLAKKKKIFSKWNCYLVNLLNFYLDRGNTEIAENVIAQLFLMKNKHENKLQAAVLLQPIIKDIINHRKQILQQNEYAIYEIRSFTQPALNNCCSQIKNFPELHKCFFECVQIFHDDYLNMLTRSAMVHLLVPPYNKDFIDKITSNFAIILKSYPIGPNDYMYHYHQITHLCLSSISNCTFKSFFIANKMFQSYNSIEDLPKEIRMKSELQLINCLLTFGLPSVLLHDVLSPLVNQHMENIERNFLNTMSFDTIMLYFIVQLKYIAFSMLQNSAPDTLDKLNNEIASFHSSIKLQFSVMPEYKNKALDMLKQLPSQLTDIITSANLPE